MYLEDLINYCEGMELKVKETTNFGSLNIGEIFISGNDVCIKTNAKHDGFRGSALMYSDDDPESSFFDEDSKVTKTNAKLVVY